MQLSVFSIVVGGPFIWGCAATLPPPTQRLADAQSVERSAREVGAERSPAAQLSLKNTQDQITRAQAAMAAGDNVQADALLIRAQADGELALAQAREGAAHVAEKKATDDAAAQRTTNIGQGAVK
jgi:Domain of unknown function (DUF4398)